MNIFYGLKYKRMGVPVIYIHKGQHHYLELSIRQSLENNKNVILIGDERNEELAKKYNIKHELFDDYNKNDFEKVYIHDKRSNSNYKFELICFQRWFVLLEVMKKYFIERCIYLDSDIFYYGNAEEEFNRINKYGEYELAFPNFSGHTTYIFSKKALQDFCDFMHKCYDDKKLFEELLKRPLIMQNKRSDMSIFQLYIHKYPKKIFDLKENHGDNIVYDGYINISEGYKTIFGKKYFTIKNNKAYFYKKEQEIETKTLHLQMHMKSYMGIIFKRQIRLFRLLLFFNYIVEYCYKKSSIIRYLRKLWKEHSLFN